MVKLRRKRRQNCSTKNRQIQSGLCPAIDLLCSELIFSLCLSPELLHCGMLDFFIFFFKGFFCLAVIFRKRMMTKRRVQRKRQTVRKKTTPRSLRWAPSSTGTGPSHRSSLLCPLRHRLSQSHHLRLFRPPSSPSSPCRTTTPLTTQGAPARSCSGYWWDSRCWASSNRVNSCPG